MKHVVIVGGLIAGTLALAAVMAGPAQQGTASASASPTARPSAGGSNELFAPGTSGMSEEQRQQLNTTVAETTAMMDEASEQMEAMSEPEYGEPTMPTD